jgi:uncharacterized protein YbbK (DUF523 family)
MLIVNKILVSACLVGRAVRYDGRAAAIDHPIIRQWQSEGRLVVVCPEVLGGLPVPRPPAQIREGTAQDVLEGKALVVNAKGEDVSPQYLGGAAAGLAAVRKHRIRVAVLKTQSPSCGPQETNHRGSGEGLMAALLRLNGVAVFGEYDIELAAKAFAGLDLEPPELPRC